jgi:toxin-antitoxin system PIN domain toxin
VSPFLLDVNVLIALLRQDHVSHRIVKQWFQRTGARDFVTCPLTEASFVRIVSNPKFSHPSLDISEAMEMLRIVTKLPGHCFWAMDAGFLDAVGPFTERLFGHQQVTDAHLLGMAVKKKGKLVTLDRAIKALAGAEFSNHVLLLE